MEESIKKLCNDITIMKSDVIENSLEPFKSQSNAALILTNRYDGIDLPDDSCRQLIIAGNPDAINLQEKFLLNSLGIFSLLKDRIVTRFTQATGRCTRGIRDRSLVILFGSTLHNFCLMHENIGVMHPELQAELKFGLDNSNVSSLDELSELCELFFEQGDEWKEQDQYIRTLRQDSTILKDKRSGTLMKIVKDEVDFQYNLWKGDYHNALKSAQRVIDKLSGDDFKGYRGFWYYFGGCSAWKLSRSFQDDGFERIAKDYFDRAMSCIDTSNWFSDVTFPSEIRIKQNEFSIVNICSAKKIKKNIIKLGVTGKTFEERMDVIKDFIYDDTPSKFEEGLKQLGDLLGFESEHPSDQAAPDSIWRIANSLLIIFEAKSDQKGDHGIPVDTCREADGHYKWTKSKISTYDEINQKYVVVVSHRTKIDNQALPFTNNLFSMHINRIREIFENVSGVYRRVRSQFTAYDEEEIKSKILEELAQKELDPQSLILEIENAPLDKLPKA